MSPVQQDDGLQSVGYWTDGQTANHTVLVSTEGTDLVCCVVVALAFGVARLGRQGPGGCLPDLQS